MKIEVVTTVVFDCACSCGAIAQLRAELARPPSAIAPPTQPCQRCGRKLRVGVADTVGLWVRS